MLHLVHEHTSGGSSQRALDSYRIYLAMNSKLTHRNDAFLNWNDGRLYGGTENFAFQEWEAYPGYEWLLANPMKDLDFSELIVEMGETSEPVTNPTDADCGSQDRNALTAPSAVSDDPFSRIPTEIRLMILELLPASSVLNLFLSGRTFHSTSFLPSFWRSRIYLDLPWFQGTSLDERISKQGRVYSRSLFHVLKNASARPLSGANTRYETHLSLKNRHRIWVCCAAILDIAGR
ncbi:uncharacterized protein BJX67DRAFT_361335 [Aspergillus lucknowensis]|uniref:F-box domain-containing protein n=1 Tax=Aspergillus lucknowensis TaxID=176173 RepID=A0ABR4LIZ7_9EURO